MGAGAGEGGLGGGGRGCPEELDVLEGAWMKEVDSEDGDGGWGGGDTGSRGGGLSVPGNAWEVVPSLAWLYGS